MKEPRVVALRYTVVCAADTDFDSAPAFGFVSTEFRGELVGSSLLLYPTRKFDSVDKALAVAVPFIRAWEIGAGVQYSSPRDFRLEFAGADIIDDAPVAGTVSLAVQEIARVTDGTINHVSRAAYPMPPVDSALGPELDYLWNRVSRYLEGKEPLTSAAYFCVSVLKMRGGFPAASAHYKISESILRRMSELSSTRGDPSTARKLTTTTQSLQPDEATWLRNALLAIVGHLLRGDPAAILTGVPSHHSPWYVTPKP